MMNRKSFLGTLFGLFGVSATAQQWKECTSGTPGKTSYVTPTDTCWVKYQKPEPALNDQCPTCGTMAEPYDDPPMCVSSLSHSAGPVPCGHHERLTRCKRCNAAFFQDSK